MSQLCLCSCHAVGNQWKPFGGATGAVQDEVEEQSDQCPVSLDFGRSTANGFMVLYLHTARSPNQAMSGLMEFKA